MYDEKRDPQCRAIADENGNSSEGLYPMMDVIQWSDNVTEKRTVLALRIDCEQLENLRGAHASILVEDRNQ